MTVETVHGRAAATARVEASPPRTAPRALARVPGWRSGLALAVATALLGLLYGARLAELARAWASDDNYSHGFLVPLVSLLVAWLAYREHGGPREGNLVLGLLWLMTGCLLHLGAVVVWLPPVDFFALAAILYGGAVLVGGRAWARHFVFPIGFLFFMFPLPVALTDRAAVWLQALVAKYGTYLLQLFLPAQQQGNFIQLPGQVMEVGEACSGLRQVIAFAALTLLVAHLSGRPLLFRVLLVLSGVPVAIAANLLRVLLMAFVMRQFGPAYISGAYHSAWGLFTMTLGLGLLVAINWWLNRILIDRDADLMPPTDTAPPASSAPRFARRSWAAALTCLAVTVVGQWLLLEHLRAGDLPESPRLQQPLTGFPVSLGAWLGQDSLPTTLPYHDHVPDDKLLRTYTLQQGPAAGLQCRLWMVHFQSGKDREHHPIICYKVAGYTEELRAHASLQLPGRPAPVERFAFSRKGALSYVYYWHYTFEPELPADLSLLQWIYQRRGRLLPSLTIEVFTDAQTPGQLEEIATFVQEVDDQVRAHVPPGARMGSDILPIKYTGDPRHGPLR